MKNPSRGYRAGRSRRSFLKGVGALGLTLPAARRALGMTATVVVINENGTVSTNAALAANPNAAQWVSPSAFVASSLETGRIGYIVAWGGNEFGYAYTYALSGAPAGVTIDPDTGILSIASPLAVRAYGFSVIVTNREVVTNIATFPISLTILQGVTANRTGSQILHKTYRPESFGSPRGTNYTAPLLAMQKQILADQSAAGDGNLRALVQFTKGRTYEYTNNHWMTGVQYYRVESTGSGANPILRNTLGDTHSYYESGPLNIGKGNAIDHGSIKASCARINDAKMGDTAVTLINANDASKIKPGRWHAVIGYCQQLGGYPPNCQRIDYVIVKSVSGSTVSLDRPLHYSYNHDWWEDPNDDGSLGQARLVPWDCGGPGGLYPNDPRTTLRGQWVNINWQFVTVGTQELDITYVESHIDLSFEGCNISDAQLSMSKNVLLSGCTVTNAEPDKLCETLVLDKCNFTDILGGTTGYQYLLMRDTTTCCIQISPRQFRCLNSKLNATGDTNYAVPFSAAYNGALWEYEFTGVNFVAAGSQKTWTWPGNGHITPLRLYASSWSGNRLIIPRSFSAFEDWLVWLYEGTTVMTGTTPLSPGNYGRVDRLYAPANGSAIWADVTWIKGTKPTSGNLYIMDHGVRKLIWGTGTQVTGGGSWCDPWFLCQQGTPANRPFPQGIS
jgi:hypothetical protein